MISLLAAALGSRRSTTLPAGLAFRADVRAPELHALLASSYVATDDGALRIAYSEAQLRWLELDLSAANRNRQAVPWIVVMGHIPLVSWTKSAKTRRVSPPS